MQPSVKKYLSDIRKKDAGEPRLTNPVKNHLADLGKRGGTAGTGESKRRSPEHYRRIAKLAVAARLRNWARNKGGKNAIKSLTN